MDFSSVESTVSYIQSFGLYGPIVAFILFFIQAIAPIIPYMIFAGAVGMIYGNWIGFLLAWSGALVGACCLFLASKRLGGNYFIQKMQVKYDFNLKELDQRSVFWVLLASRIFPIVPTPLLNVGSGLAGVDFWVFTSSSAIGKIPWAIAYVALGDYFIKTKNITVTLIIIAAIIVFSVLGIHAFQKWMPGLTHKKFNSD